MRLGECDDAVSSIIGVTLLGGMTVVMASIIGVSVFDSTIPDNVPHAKIVIVEVKGDIGYMALNKNIITLKHKGGDSLYENNTKIIITGKGYMYTSGDDPHLASAQDVRVTYADLSGMNYIPSEGYFREIVEGTSWDAGETITLYGSDGVAPFGIHHNTVDNKWKIDDDSTVSVTIIDRTTNEVIAVSRATVKDA